MKLSCFCPADFGFDLNNREIAALIWLGVIALGLLLWANARRSILSVARSFFVWKLQQVFLVMTIYMIIIVTLLAKLNLWEWANLKTTILWWLTVGFASIFQAQRIAKEQGAFRRLLAEALSLTAALTFIAEFASFPLLLELFVPVPLTFVAIVLAMAPHQQGAEILVKPLNRIMIVAGLGYLGWGVYEILAYPAAFLNLNTLREFADPIILSIAFVPFLYALAMFMERETLFTSLKVMWTRPDLVAYAQRRSLLAFGFDLDATRRLARDLKMNNIESRKGVGDTIKQIKRLKRRENNPSSVPADQGWSPYEAVCFLEVEGVVANDWHPAFGEWRAEASTVKLGDEFSPDTVSYYLSGVEFATTRLVLILNANNRNDTTASDARYYKMMLMLLERAMPLAEAQAMFERLHDQDEIVIRETGWRFSMTKHSYGAGMVGGYSRHFKMTHKAHVPMEYDEEYFEALKPE